MATKAKTTTKAKAKASTAAKKADKTVAAAKASRPAVAAKTPTSTPAARSRFLAITPQALVAEAVGTFGLALVAVTAPSDQPLLVGVTLAVLLVAMIGISGGHFNPAVTFGLWAANKLESIKLPFYWLAQFIGALAAFMVVGAYNGNGSNLDMGSFTLWDWRTFWVELVGSAIFLFGLIAVVKNVPSLAGRAAGIGLSLVAGLVIGGGLLTASATREQTAVQNGQSQSVTQTFAAQGAALNPAVALAQTERDVKTINGSIAGQSSAATVQKTPSHFTVSVILGTLIGAALGTNLYLVLAGLSWKNREL